jgi:hypothetical protein
MKVTAFTVSGSMQYTYNVSEKFSKNLQLIANADYEIVRLIDYSPRTLKGGKLCLDTSEELCPFRTTGIEDGLNHSYYKSFYNHFSF